MRNTFKLIMMSLVLTFTMSSVFACPSQIVVLPDGRMMVCYYCNNGKLVNCENL